MQPETEAPLEQARPNMEEWESALAAPILPRIEPEPIREAAPPKAETPKKGKARIIKAETLAAAKAKQEQEKAAEQEEELQEEELREEEQSDAVSPSLTEASEEAAEQAEQESAPQSEKQKEKIHALEDELAQMRKMLRQVMDQSSSGEDVTTLKDALRAQELREDVMQDIIRKIPPATMMLGKDSAEAVKALGDYLHSVIKTGDGIGLKDGRPKIVALIGTTGVGKTTTIAKIAAKYVLERGVSVALVTADTYRISAVDQLRTYSDIIGLPLEIVYSPEELKPALRKHRDKKLILIDTAGRSQNNDYQMDELKEFLAVEPSIEKHLVLSATTKERDAEAILERFSVCRPDRILMTKTDETESIGFIVNLLFDRRLAMSYLTTGQSVPDDIEPAKPEALARLMLR
jgi:flagellar biosynthesis protein FlhF